MRICMSWTEQLIDEVWTTFKQANDQELAVNILTLSELAELRDSEKWHFLVEAAVQLQSGNVTTWGFSSIEDRRNMIKDFVDSAVQSVVEEIYW